MSYQLVLLGLLAEQPRHGYEIKQILEEGSFADYVKMSGGGLYYNLNKLVKEGYISGQTVEREGNYPERHIYGITPEGKKYLIRLLRDTLSDIEGRNIYDPLDAALLFSPLLSRDEVLIRLKRQADRRRGKLAQLQLIYSALKNLPNLNEPYLLLLLQHSLHRVQSDLTWLETAHQQVRDDPAFASVHKDSARSRLTAPENLRPTDQPTGWTREGYTPQEWQAFEAGLGRALLRYNARVEQAWREYDGQERVFGNSPEHLEKARQDYDRKIEQAWQEYQQALQPLAHTEPECE